MVSKPIAGYSFQIQMDAPLSCYTPILQKQDKQKTLEERKKRKCVCARAREGETQWKSNLIPAVSVFQRYELELQNEDNKLPKKRED